MKKIGAPSLYNPVETPKKAAAYIRKEHMRITKKGYKLSFPSIAGLCTELGVVKNTLYNWGREHEEFGSLLAELNQRQEQLLLENGLNGMYNPVITKLVLGKHGYKDQMGLSGEGEGEPIKTDVNVLGAINRIYGKDK